MIPIIIIISFIFDSVFSNFISINGIFIPLFTLMSLIIIYPYFNGKNTKYLEICFITGMFYDLIYTDTIIVEAFLFLIIGFIITKLNLVLANNWLNDSIMALICITIYRILSYGLFLITGASSFDILVLLKSIYSSLIVNLIYTIILLTITDKISRNLKIHKSS